MSGLQISPTGLGGTKGQVGSGLGAQPGLGFGLTYYIFRDLFNRYADNTVMNGQVPLVGPAWVTTGASLPTTTGGYLNNSGTGYLYTNLSVTPQSLGCKVNFSSGTTKTMTMAFSSQTPPTLFIKDLLHFNFGYNSFTLGYFDASGTFNALMTGNWSSVMTYGTNYQLYFGVVNSSVGVVVGPNGEIFAVNDPNVAANWGPMVFTEPTSSVAFAAEFYGTNNKVVFPGTTTWNPSQKTTDITLSSGNLSATSAPTTAAPQVLSVAGRTHGKVYFEVTCNTVANPTVADYAIGIASLSQHTLTTDVGGDLKSVGCWGRTGASNQSHILIGNSPTNIGTGFGYNSGDVIAIAVDFDTGGGLFWAKNLTKGTGWNNDVLANQNPATGTGGFSGWNSGAPFGIAVEMQDSTDQCTLNAGASNYVGTPPSSFGNWL